MPTQTPPAVLVFALWAAGLGAAGQFAKISVPFATLRESYPEAGIGLGFLLSLNSFLGIVLGLVAGMIVGRLGYRRLLLPALLLGSAVSLFQATMPSLPVFLASRVLEGLSHLVIVVAAPTLIAQVSTDRHRAAAMTLWSTFVAVSYALLAWIGLPLVEARGPGALFLGHGIFLASMAGILALWLPGDSGPARDTDGFSLRDILRRHREVYASPSQSAPALGWLFYTLTFISLLTIIPEMLVPDIRALLAGFMPLAGIAVSLTLGIALLRRFAAVQVSIAGFALGIAVLALLAIFPGQPILCVALFGALGLVQGSGFAAIPQLNPERQAQANANGAMAQMGNLGNTLGTPLLLTAMSAFGYAGLIGMGILCYLGAIATHVALARRRWRLGL